MVVCVMWLGCTNTAQQFSSTTSSTSTVTCSPRWIVYPRSGALGAVKYYAANTPKKCLEACVAESTCVVAEWSTETEQVTGCWLHNNQARSRQRNYHVTVTQFEIVRHCYPSSGTWCEQNVLLRVFRSINYCIFAYFHVVFMINKILF